MPQGGNGAKKLPRPRPALLSASQNCPSVCISDESNQLPTLYMPSGPHPQISITATLQAAVSLNVSGHTFTLEDVGKVTKSKVTENQAKPKQPMAQAVRLLGLAGLEPEAYACQPHPALFSPAFLCIDFIPRPGHCLCAVIALSFRLMPEDSKSWSFSTHCPNKNKEGRGRFCTVLQCTLPHAESRKGQIMPYRLS